MVQQLDEAKLLVVFDSYVGAWSCGHTVARSNQTFGWCTSTGASMALAV